MPGKKQNSRGAAGSGSIRKKVVRRGGKEYVYWEARCTVGYDSKTGKQKQKSITGKTQKEVAQKLREILSEIDRGTYCEPSRLTVDQWMDIWLRDYLRDLSCNTRTHYASIVRTHIKPTLGRFRLEELHTHMIQRFYGDLQDKGMAPGSVRFVHAVLHGALQRAVAIHYLRANPADGCVLPRNQRRELTTLDDDMIRAFMDAIKGNPYELLYLVALFTGLRQGELLGLTWSCVDFHQGTLLINKQIQKVQTSPKRYDYQLVPTKSRNSRTITPAREVLTWLQRQRATQSEWRLRAGPAWQNDRDLVFTNELGDCIKGHSIYCHFKRIMAKLGFPGARFHDLRHTYAVTAIRAGDDIKTVQENMGHASASFTLNVYGYVTEQMRRESSERMEKFIQNLG